MSMRDKAAVIESLCNRWSANHAPAAGTTCNATVQPAGKFARVNLQQLGWSFKNLTAANATAVLEVRDASIAGTLLASWEIIVGAGLSVQDSFTLAIQGLRNSPLSASFNTVQASVAQRINIAGWQDTLGDG